MHERADVELAARVAVFAISDSLAVDPDVIRGLDAVEVNEGSAVAPPVGKVERRSVLADGVVDGGGVRVVAGGLGLLVPAVRARPRKDRVGADREVVPVQLPARGNRDRVPTGVVEPWLREGELAGVGGR